MVVGFAVMGDMVELMVLAFVMPSAERDMCMNNTMKGWLGRKCTITKLVQR